MLPFPGFGVLKKIRIAFANRVLYTLPLPHSLDRGERESAWTRTGWERERGDASGGEGRGRLGKKTRAM